MKIVVLGSSGMLGRILSLHLISKKKFKTKLFSRNKSRIKKVDKKINYLKYYTKKNIKKIIKSNRPCIVVNCIGVTNQNLNFTSYKNLNSKLPHMIKEQIDRLVFVLQAMTMQRMDAIREGRQREALQIQSVAIDIDNKIQELENSLS